MNRFLFWIIKLGAMLPVGVKGAFTERIFSRMLNLYKRLKGNDRTVNSNLGINNNLKVQLPVLKVPSCFLFGDPHSYNGEYYSLQLASYLNRYCSAFVDIGANWGFYSYFIALQTKKPIYWFEPNSFLFENINTNIRKNRLEQVTGSKLALSDNNGHLTFYLDHTSDLQSTIVAPEHNHNITKEQIEATRFDHWVEKNSIPNHLLVKVDVENAEWQFIKGAVHALDKVDYLLIEVLGPARQSGFVNYLIKEFQFHAYYINKESIEYVKEEDMRYTAGEYNWLFCRNHPSELKQKLAGSIFTVSEA